MTSAVRPSVPTNLGDSSGSSGVGTEGRSPRGPDFPPSRDLFAVGTTRIAGPGRSPSPVALTTLDGDLASLLRPRLEALVDRIVSQIQDGVDAYSGPRHGRRRRLIEAAVGAAVHYFADAIEGRTDGHAEVDVLFRRLGRAEALEGNSLQAIREAHEIAIRDAWHTLHTMAVAIGLSAAALGQLGDALFALMEHLGDQVSLGYHAARAELGQASHRARAELVDQLLEPSADTDLEQLASRAQWPLAPMVVLALGESHADAQVGAVLVDADLLVRVDREATAVVIPDRHPPGSGTRHGEAGAGFPSPGLVDELRDVLALDRVAVSWPVSLDEAPDALRWCRRALALAHHGVLGPAPVIDCADHATTLWLHSEPRLRRRVSRDVLAPLLRETPHSRQVLSRTLLAWLSTHDSAPVLARRLGVHAQTVRYRLRRLQALLGDRLEDPESVLAMKLALEASLPLWEAGHVSADVEQTLRPDLAHAPSPTAVPDEGW